MTNDERDFGREVAAPSGDASVADLNKVRMGGLHGLLPWIVKLLGG